MHLLSVLVAPRLLAPSLFPNVAVSACNLHFFFFFRGGGMSGGGRDFGQGLTVNTSIDPEREHKFGRAGEAPKARLTHTTLFSSAEISDPLVS